MRRLADIDALASGPDPFVTTVGAFDGLHRGHLRLLAATVAEARRLAAVAAVITFTPHPDAVLHGAAPPLLCDPAEQRARFAAAGVDRLVEQRFDREFSAQTAEAFVRRLAAGGRLRGLVLTPESAFGRDRGGNAASIAPLGRELGFRVAAVEPVSLGGRRVSSGQVRELIAAGRLGAARTLLGRRPAVVGEVVHGDGRGRELGFPTANLRFETPVALPPNGIYAVEASWGGESPLAPARRAGGAASLGIRPMFAVPERLLEVFLLDISEDLYGEQLRVDFVRRLRGERRFRSIGALVTQMGRDATRARTELTRARR